METLLWHYRYGRPKEQVDISVSVAVVAEVRVNTLTVDELHTLHRFVGRIEAALAAAEQRAAAKLYRYCPDAGPARRALHAKQLQCFAAGARHRTRAFLAANRSGKPKKVALIASMRKLLTILNVMMRTNASWRQTNHQEMA